MAYEQILGRNLLFAHRAIRMLATAAILSACGGSSSSSSSTSVDGCQADANTVCLGATKDNTLYEINDGSLSNGAGERFFVGRVGPMGGGALRRGVIAFDIAGNIPAGSTITDVTLTLHNTSPPIFPGPINPETVELHKLLANWGEGTSDAPGPRGGGAGLEEGVGAPATPNDATWVHTFFDTETWGTPGGDFVPTVSANASVGGTGSYNVGSFPQMVADVQDWFDNPGNNFGWLLQGNEAILQTARQFDTRESSVAADRPVLQVDFTPPAAP